MGLYTKTDCLTDRQLHCDFDFGLISYHELFSVDNSLLGNTTILDNRSSVFYVVSARQQPADEWTC
jgi:hypothetical protein